MAEAVIMELRSRSVIRCDRCRRTTRLGCAKEWNATFRAGRIVCFLCPGRQTPEENAEAIMNEATTDYIGLDERGRFIGRPKPVISRQLSADP